MAEEIVPTGSQLEQTEPHGNDGSSAATTDWKAESRKWEGRAKENMGEVVELKTLNDAQMTDLEAARAEAEEAKAEAARLRAEKARGDAVKAAAQECQVDSELLDLMAGDTPEQIAANAAILKAKLAAIPAYPSIPDNGAGLSPSITKEQIEAIKNPAERIAQRAKHSELYK